MRPTSETLNRLFSYDPGTGILRYKPRPIEMFNGGKRPEGAMLTWNGSRAGKIAYSLASSGYVKVGVLGRQYRAHLVILAMVNGSWPNEEVDHINGIKSDNRLCNLRIVGRCENMKNTAISSRNTSGFCGVTWHKQIRKWVAYIKVNKKNLYLGAFADIKDAVAARRYAEVDHGFHPNHGRQKHTAAPKRLAFVADQAGGCHEHSPA